MYKVIYSQQAEKDLSDAIDYIAAESVPNALTYLRGYEERVELLQSHPSMGLKCSAKLIKRDLC